MPIKLKPSSREYLRDSKGKMTKKWVMKHYTTAGTATDELLKMLSSNSSLKKNRSKIEMELNKRGVIWEKQSYI